MSPIGRAFTAKCVAACLALEVLRSVSWIGRILSVAAAYDGAVFIMVALRAAVTALQFPAVTRLWQGAPAGRRLGEAALASSAALIVLEIGLALSPSSIVPGFRWPLVIAYGVYAGGAIALLRFSDSDK